MEPEALVSGVVVVSRPVRRTMRAGSRKAWRS